MKAYVVNHSSPPKIEHQRQHDRKQVYRTVQWDHRTGENIGGALCDLSPSGTFLAPFGKNAEQIRDGDTVWVTITNGDELHSLSATVRWNGWSDRHSTRGFGLEFDATSRSLAKKLILEFDQEGMFFVPA